MFHIICHHRNANWNVTTHLNRPRPRTPATLNAGEDVEQQKLDTLLVGMQNDTATLEDRLAIS